MIGSVEEEDAREQRRRQREEARANGGQTAPAAATSAAMPAQAAAPTARPAAFELVGDLPDSKGPGGRKVPAVRTQMMEFAKAHPGQWIRYNPTPEDPFKHANSLGDSIRKGHGGFGEGFEASVRDKVLFVRYVGKQTGATP